MVGIVPPHLRDCVAIFVDARDLACQVRLLLLPPVRVSVHRILQLIGAPSPQSHVLHFSGVSLCEKGESFVPVPNAVVKISVGRKLSDEPSGHFPMPPQHSAIHRMARAPALQNMKLLLLTTCILRLMTAL